MLLSSHYLPTAVPFWGKPTQISSSLPLHRDCGSKCPFLSTQLHQYTQSAVSVLIPCPREMLILWLQTAVKQRKKTKKQEIIANKCQARKTPAYRVREHNNTSKTSKQEQKDNNTRTNPEMKHNTKQMTQGVHKKAARRKAYVLRNDQISAARTNQHEGEEDTGKLRIRAITGVHS